MYKPLFCLNAILIYDDDNKVSDRILKRSSIINTIKMNFLNFITESFKAFEWHHIRVVELNLNIIAHGSSTK